MSYDNSASQRPFASPSANSKILVVGLGNPILGDDGVGWRVAEGVEEALLKDDLARPNLEVACCALGGLSLMERLIGFDLAIIIDAVQTTGGAPGQVYDLKLEDLPDYSTGHMTAAHDTSLQTALQVGRAMGAALPHQIRVIGIEAERVYDFSEALSPSVEAAVLQAVQLVMYRLGDLQNRHSEASVQ